MTSQNSNSLNENTSINNHPFIWGNIALIAAVPWLLAQSMAGLAVGDPVFSSWFEIFLLGFPAIVLVVWVQWQQPFSPFSLWFLVKPSEDLSEDERRLLTLVKQQKNGWYMTGWIAIAVALVMSVIFSKLYIAAPLAQAIAPFPAGLRLFGILWAEVCFLLSNILLQSGLSAVRIKLTANSDFASLQPFAVEKIKNNFTSIGWRSPQILKFFEEEATEKSQDIIEVGSEDKAIEVIPEIESVDTLEVLEEVKTVIDESLDANASIDQIAQVQIDEFVDVADDVHKETMETPLEESEINESSEEIEAIADLPEIITETDSEEISQVTISITQEHNQETSAIVEDLPVDEIVEEFNSSVVLESTESESIISTIVLTEEITFLDMVNVEPEGLFDQAPEQVQDTSETKQEELITTEISESPKTKNNTKPINLFGKSSRKGFSQKNHGFGKSTKNILVNPSEQTEPNIPQEDKLDRNEVIDNIPEISYVAPPLEVTDSVEQPINDLVLEPVIEAIANIEDSDFDNDLDELSAFNVYVENILQEYLEEENQEVEDTLTIAAVSEQTSDIAKEILLSEEISETAVPEPIDIPIEFTPEIEAIAQTTEITKEEKDAKYLVQEFLVDKFLARLEELNKTDKSIPKQNIEENPESNVQPLTDDSLSDQSPKNEEDEFAELEKLLNRNKKDEN